MNAKNTFLADHDIDKMVAANIDVEVRATDNTRTSSSRTLGAIALFREETSGIHTLTDEEPA